MQFGRCSNYGGSLERSKSNPSIRWGQRFSDHSSIDNYPSLPDDTTILDAHRYYQNAHNRCGLDLLRGSYENTQSRKLDAVTAAAKAYEKANHGSKHLLSGHTTANLIHDISLPKARERGLERKISFLRGRREDTSVGRTLGFDNSFHRGGSLQDRSGRPTFSSGNRLHGSERGRGRRSNNLLFRSKSTKSQSSDRSRSRFAVLGRAKGFGLDRSAIDELDSGRVSQHCYNSFDSEGFNKYNHIKSGSLTELNEGFVRENKYDLRAAAQTTFPETKEPDELDLSSLNPYGEKNQQRSSPDENSRSSLTEDTKLTCTRDAEFLMNDGIRSSSNTTHAHHWFEENNPEVIVEYEMNKLNECQPALQNNANDNANDQCLTLKASVHHSLRLKKNKFSSTRIKSKVKNIFKLSIASFGSKTATGLDEKTAEELSKKKPVKLLPAQHVKASCAYFDVGSVAVSTRSNRPRSNASTILASSKSVASFIEKRTSNDSGTEKNCSSLKFPMVHPRRVSDGTSFSRSTVGRYSSASRVTSWTDSTTAPEIGSRTLSEASVQLEGLQSIPEAHLSKINTNTIVKPETECDLVSKKNLVSMSRNFYKSIMNVRDFVSNAKDKKTDDDTPTEMINYDHYRTPEMTNNVEGESFTQIGYKENRVSVHKVLDSVANGFRSAVLESSENERGVESGAEKRLTEQPQVAITRPTSEQIAARVRRAERRWQDPLGEWQNPTECSGRQWGTEDGVVLNGDDDGDQLGKATREIVQSCELSVGYDSIRKSVTSPSVYSDPTDGYSAQDVNKINAFSPQNEQNEFGHRREWAGIVPDAPMNFKENEGLEVESNDSEPDGYIFNQQICIPRVRPRLSEKADQENTTSADQKVQDQNQGHQTANKHEHCDKGTFHNVFQQPDVNKENQRSSDARIITKQQHHSNLQPGDIPARIRDRSGFSGDRSVLDIRAGLYMNANETEEEVVEHSKLEKSGTRQTAEAPSRTNTLTSAILGCTSANRGGRLHRWSSRSTQSPNPNLLQEQQQQLLQQLQQQHHRQQKPQQHLSFPEPSWSNPATRIDKENVTLNAQVLMGHHGHNPFFYQTKQLDQHQYQQESTHGQDLQQQMQHTQHQPFYHYSNQQDKQYIYDHENGIMAGKTKKRTAENISKKVSTEIFGRGVVDEATTIVVPTPVMGAISRMSIKNKTTSNVFNQMNHTSDYNSNSDNKFIDSNSMISIPTTPLPIALNMSPRTPASSKSAQSTGGQKLASMFLESRRGPLDGEPRPRCETPMFL